ALSEMDERGDRAIDRLVVERAGRERVVTQAHRDALGLDAHDVDRLELGDHDTDRIRSRIDRREPRSRRCHDLTVSLSRRAPSPTAIPSDPYFFPAVLVPPLAEPLPSAFGGPAFSGILIWSPGATPLTTSTLMPSDSPSSTSWRTNVCGLVSTSTNGL